MLGTRTFTLNLLIATTLWGQQDYLPLQVGNQWVYRGKLDSFSVNVDSSSVVNGQEYFLVRGLPGSPDISLRSDGRGRLMMLDVVGKTERVWLDLSSEDPVPAGVDQCNSLSQVDSRAAKFTGPVGYFETAVRVKYSGGNCADAGLVTDVFLPYVGILQRSVQSIAGPAIYDLVYAHLGEATLISEPVVSFEVAVDRAAASVRLTLRNKTGSTLELPFPTGQRFDVAVRDQDGKDVWHWSDGMFFTQDLGTERIAAERNWAATLPALKPGTYTVEGWLTSNGPKKFRATTSIEVTP